MIHDADYQRLPPPIKAKLEVIISRWRKVVLSRGIVAVFGVTTVIMLMVMAVDAFLVLDSDLMRWAGFATVVCAFFFSLYYHIVRRVMFKLTLASVARSIEMRHPEIEERISSTVEILSSKDRSMAGVSEQLLDELVAEAINETSEVSPTREISVSSLKPYVITLAVSAAVFAMLWLVWPLQTSLLVVRVLSPGSKVGNVFSTGMNVQPGDTTIASGDALAIEVEIGGRHGSHVELRRVSPSGLISIEKMERVGESDGRVSYRLEFPAVAESFGYRVVSGRAVTESFSVVVVARPEITELTVMYRFPEYTGMGTRRQAGAPSDISAISGTELDFAASLNKQITSGEVLLDAKQVPMEKPVAGQEPPMLKWKSILSGKSEASWQVNLVDEFGIKGGTPTLKIKSVPDAAPTIRILEPAQKVVTVRPTETVPVIFVASDDFAVTGADLCVGIGGAKPEPTEMKIELFREEGEKVWRGALALSLTSLKLDTAREVKLQVRVFDNLPEKYSGPQLSFSEIITLKIDRSAKSFLSQALDKQGSEIRKDLEAVLARLEKARQKAEGKAQTAAKSESLSEKDRADLQAVREETAAAEAMAKDLGAKIKESAFNRLAEELLEVADEHIKPAHEASDLMLLADDPIFRGEKAKKMDAEIAKSIEGVKKTLSDLNELDHEVAAFAKITDLAEREKYLAEKAELIAASPDADKILQDWQKEQDALRNEMMKTAAENPEAKKLLAEQHARQAAELGKQAQKIADTQKQLEKATGLLDDGKKGAIKDTLTDILAKRQDDTTQQMQELEQGKLQEVLKYLQEQIAEEAGELGGELAELRKDLEKSAMGDPSRNAASSAQQQIASGEKSANESAKMLETPALQQKPEPPALQPGEPAPALPPDPMEPLRKTQQETAAQMQNAVSSLRDLGKKLEQVAVEAGRKARQEAGAHEVGQPLAEAVAQADEAAQMPTAESAAEKADAAARALSKAMQAAADNLGMPDFRQGQGQEQMSASDGKDGWKKQSPTGEKGSVARMGVSIVDWIKIKGQLTPEAASAAIEDAPPEYRELVRRYFQQLATEGVTREESK